MSARKDGSRVVHGERSTGPREPAIATCGLVLGLIGWTWTDARVTCRACKRVAQRELERLLQP